MHILTHTESHVLTITINRPERRNAVDRETAQALYEAFCAFEENDALRVAILTGQGNHFCAGADLKAIAQRTPNRIKKTGCAPMGPTRMLLKKPLIAAIEGYAVAGGLELALLADLRVAAENATLGVFCRRVGVPLIDGGTIRLPRIIGQGRALDLILTGRPVDSPEALTMGLINRIAPKGKSLDIATELAKQIASHPQCTMLGDRRSAYEQFDMSLSDALNNELSIGLDSLKSQEYLSGATAFEQGQFRHGSQS